MASPEQILGYNSQSSFNPFMGLSVSRQKIRSKPDVIRSRVRGTTRAVRFIKDRPAEAQNHE